MKSRWYRYTLIALLLSFLSFHLFALEVPKLKRRVTDFAGVLSPTQQMTLEEKLYLFEAQTSNQIAVLIVESLENETIEDYSIQVVDQWKLGDAEKENGALLLIAVRDRSMRIEVGYGLEGALTDMLSSSIIRNEISPKFRQGDYYGGIDAGITAIMLATKNEYKADPRQYSRSRGETTKSFGSLIMFILFFFLFLVSGRRGRRGLFWALLGASMFRGGGGGGGFGGGGFSGFSGGGGGFGGGGASGGW